jgi:hypothetical protein
MDFSWYYYRSVSVVLDTSCFQTATILTFTTIVVLLRDGQIINTDLGYTLTIYYNVSANLIIIPKVDWSRFCYWCSPGNNINR